MKIAQSFPIVGMIEYHGVNVNREKRFFSFLRERDFHGRQNLSDRVMMRIALVVRQENISLCKDKPIPDFGVLMVFNLDFFASEPEQQDTNTLIQYLQQQQPETLARIAQSASSDVKEIISQNVQGLVGMLPNGDFNVQITTDRENLANLLASAMMTGYFLSQMEQRKNLDSALSQIDPFHTKPKKQNPES